MKKQSISICGSVFLVMLVMLSEGISAQQSRVDSAIALLNKSNVEKGPDSLSFSAAVQLVEKSVLTDPQISQLEAAAGQFKKGTKEIFYYLVCRTIFRSLSGTDRYKSIEYGKRLVGQLEKVKSADARFLKQILLLQLRLPYRESDKLKEGFQYYADQLNEFKKANDSIGISNCYYVLGGFYRIIGLYEPAIYNMKKSVSYIDSSGDNVHRMFDIVFDFGMRRWVNNAGVLSDFYAQSGEFDLALKQGKMVLEAALRLFQPGRKVDTADALQSRFTARHVVIPLLAKQQLDSVEYYLSIAESAYKETTTEKSIKAYVLQLRALYNIRRGSFAAADTLLQECWKWVNRYQVGVSQPGGIIEPDYYLALLRMEEKNFPEAIRLLHRDVERMRAVRTSVLRDYRLLADLYEKTGDDVKAKLAYKSFMLLQDSILADQSKFRTLSFETEQLIANNEIAIAQLESANKLSAQSRNFTIGIAALLFILAGSIYYRFYAKKKANLALEKALGDLKTTQSQLVQAEKMASLGELTAGIAHEIQNPLNFVNNFSELNKELINELVDEVDKGNAAEVKMIASDIKENSDKINHHGKRADAIVKGMLQHSRSGSGKKEPTDINALADEYLRLAYHGLRAKDHSFNATMKTSFDPAIGNINIVEQDIGRVILNLISNAFYAVNEQSKQGIPGYTPTVEVSTKKTGNKIEVMVRDNGNGIPAKVLDKIFQPFFTTKPTGQGTGLGLSLSYDIVKAHGGEFTVESKEGEGSEFIFQLYN
jgi:signal transduction histidine kinase